MQVDQRFGGGSEPQLLTDQGSKLTVKEQLGFTVFIMANLDEARLHKNIRRYISRS